jgi:hypothetical protein
MQQQAVWGGQNNILGTGVLFPQKPHQTQPVVQNKGRNITSVGRGPLGWNRFGRGKNQTGPKLIGLNRFLVRFKKLKQKFGLVVYFGSKPDRTRNAQPYKIWPISLIRRINF